MHHQRNAQRPRRQTARSAGEAAHAQHHRRPQPPQDGTGLPQGAPKHERQRQQATHTLAAQTGHADPFDRNAGLGHQHRLQTLPGSHPGHRYAARAQPLGHRQGRKHMPAGPAGHDQHRPRAIHSLRILMARISTSIRSNSASAMHITTTLLPP